MSSPDFHRDSPSKDSSIVWISLQERQETATGRVAFMNELYHKYRHCQVVILKFFPENKLYRSGLFLDLIYPFGLFYPARDYSWDWQWFLESGNF